ncbi:MAG: hypothetical protein Q4B68_01325 [Bacteroidales bacterium]|nr:hypothetical protein [Bacteroidales bacterium]
MNRILQILSIIGILLCASAAWGKNVVIDLGPMVGSDVTRTLRAQLRGLTSADMATINLSKKGKYYVSGTVEAKCNIKIVGQGRKKSQFVLCNGADSKDFKAFTDDTFFGFMGTLQNPITVEISNVDINLKEHEGFWWINKNDGIRTEKFAVKIYHAKKVDVRKVNSKLKNAVCTNFNMRVCSNITFQDCVLENYNNCIAGGIIWIEGATSEVNISRNVISKYGNDEALAIYASQIDMKGGRPVNGSIAKKNIRIANNTFNYAYSGKDKAQVMNDVLITFFSEGKEDSPCTLEDMCFENNSLNIADPVRITLMATIAKSDYIKNVRVSNNEFLNAVGNDGGQQFYKTDIKIIDHGSHDKGDPITISDNTFTNESSVLTRWGSTGLSHIQMAAGTVDFRDNIMDNSLAAQENQGASIAYITAGSAINLIDNKATGLAKLSVVSSSETIDKAAINASGNEFEGVTTIYCDNVTRLDLNFDSNIFRSANMNFFLQEFAKEGTVIFNNNDVRVAGGNGQLMTHWSNADVRTLKFHKLEVRSNTFFGVKNVQDMLTNIKTVTNRNISNNIFY